MIVKDGKKIIPFYEDYKPVEVRKNNIRIAGWLTETKSGEAVDFEGTYNDKAEVTVKGKSLQKSEWVIAEAVSTQVNPLTNIIPENKRKFEGWNAWKRAVVTLTQNVSVPEWNTDEATRIQTSGGTEVVKYQYSAGINPQGRKVQNRIYIKNVGTANVRVSINQRSWGDYPTEQAIGAGQTAFIVLNGVGNGTSVWQLQFKAQNIDDNLDFIAYDPRMIRMDDEPMPDNPFPITSNLPAGTYKTQDYKGDWYEFTLDEDLHGIDDVRDAVEFDRYSHNGRCLNNIVKKIFNGTESIVYTSDSPVNGTNTVAFAWTSTTVKMSQNPISTHFLGQNIWNMDKEGVWVGGSQLIWLRIAKSRLVGWSDALTDTEKTNLFKAWLTSQFTAGTPVTVVYQLATPVRTPLTFTKNNDSTAPELPMEFLTNTPSIDYPAEVFDASGTVTSMGRNLFDYKKPPLRLVTLTHELIPGGVKLTKNGAAWQNVYWSIPKILAGKDVTIVFDADDEVSMLDNYVTLRWGNNLRNLEPADTVYAMKYGKNVCVFSAPAAVSDYDYFCFHIQRAQNKDGSLYLTKMMVLEGNYETQNLPQYVPYFGEPVTIGFPTLRKVGEIADEYNLKSGQVIRRIGHIESYNGEDVGDDWISSTGALDTGATVEYVLAEPIITHLDPATVPTYPWYTRIEQDGAVKGVIEARAKVME